MLDHYRSLGVESFLINVHLSSPDDPVLEEVRAIANAFGVKIASVTIGNWQDLIVPIYAKTRAAYPKDWHIIADQDEFHSYPCELSELEKICNRRGYDYVSGCWIDRIAHDGGFPDVERSSAIWSQFPFGAFVSYVVAAADPRKVVFARSTVPVCKGQHFALKGRGCPIEEAFVQVHHFKWVSGVMQALKARAELLAKGGYTQHVESARLLKYIHLNGGRFNLADPALLAANCLQDYPHWSLIQTWLRTMAEYWELGKVMIPGPYSLLCHRLTLAQHAGNLQALLGQDRPLQPSARSGLSGLEPLRQIWLNNRY
jgi:hypothetical protein